MSANTTNFLLSAADVSWGRRERNCVTAVADSSGSLDAKYYTLDAPASPGGANQEFYVWFDVDNLSVDPAPAGKTGIEVDIATDDTAATVALAMQTAVEANGSFRAKLDSSNSANVIIDSEFIGEVDASATDVDTGFTFLNISSGLGGDLGKTLGGVSVSMETSSVKLTSDQTGGSSGLTVDEVLLGNNVSVTMTLIEMTPARWKTVVGSVTGDAYTPAAGTEVVGYGESRLYQSLFDLGGELVLHPTRKASSDKSFDITLYKCAPKPASINFSPDEAQGMEVTFDALPDGDVQGAIRIMGFGDSSQDIRS